MIYFIDPERSSATGRVRHHRMHFRLVEESPTVAAHAFPTLVFPLPDEEQMIALDEAAAYLALVGRQVACMLLGCPPLGEGVTTIAEFSDALLRSAMLCDGLRELAESQRRL